MVFAKKGKNISQWADRHAKSYLCGVAMPRVSPVATSVSWRPVRQLAEHACLIRRLADQVVEIGCAF